MGNGVMTRSRALLGAAAVFAAVVLAPARPATASTACGAIITNTADVTWTSVWGQTITGAMYTQTSASATALVAGATFTTVKDWFNVTKGSKTNPNLSLIHISEPTRLLSIS